MKTRNETESTRRYWAALRVLCGLRQEDVARELGVTKGTVCKWERGYLRPRQYREIALKAVLDGHLQRNGLKPYF